MKKILPLIILIIIFALSIYFYTNKNKDSKQNVQEITFWTLQMNTYSNYINKIINEFEIKNPNTKVIWIDIPYAEGEKRTLAAILNNNPPDLVNLTPDFSITLAEKKALYFIPASAAEHYIKPIMRTLKYKDNYYALPFYVTSALTLYNTDIVNKAGINYIPKTYDELYKNAELIKDKTGKFVTMPTLTENDTFLKILNKYDINSPEAIKNDKTVQIFNTYKYLYKNDLIPKESITQSHREALEKYMAGEIAFLSAGANFLNLIKENSPQIFKSTDVSTQLTGSLHKYDFSLMNLVIPKKSNNPELALKFAIFLTNKENQIGLSKLTSILPANKFALNDKYFTYYDDKDIISKARVISANQLKNIQPPMKRTNNQKEFIQISNKYTQEIILGKTEIKSALNEFSREWLLLAEKH